MALSESYCFDGCQSYWLVSASDTHAKSGASATLNLAGSAPRAALITNGYYVAGTFALAFAAASCAPTNPGACSSGLTVALWAGVDASPVVGGAPVVLFNAGPPTYAGVSLHLLAGTYATGASAARVNLVAVVDTGAQTWSANVELDAGLLIGAWHNYALSWAPNYGIFIFVDGLIVGAPKNTPNSICSFYEHTVRYWCFFSDFFDIHIRGT